MHPWPGGPVHHPPVHRPARHPGPGPSDESDTVMSDVQTSETQAAATPESVRSWLVDGADRFASGARTDRDLAAQVVATADGQHPLAAIVSCIDSRVPPEIVLDTGIGDVFAARTAGNVVDDDVLGSLEFAAAVAGVKVIAVLGHTACGAVKGACDGVELGHLTGLLAKITPAVRRVSGQDAPGSGDAAVVDAVVEANVVDQMAVITDRSEVLRGLVDDGRLAIVGGVYDLGTGATRWLSV